MKTRTYDEHGIHVVEDICPEGYVVIDEYTPCHSTTPWDYYGMCHVREYLRVLASAGVDGVRMETRRSIIHPHGTGYKGAVRFGDNMIPHVYKIAARTEDVDKATAAIVAHKEALNVWLNKGGEMPEACRT